MNYKQTGIQLLSIACMACVWEFIAWTTELPALFPSLGELLRQLFLLFGTPGFYTAVAISIGRGIVGLSIAFFCSFLSGTLAAFSPFWHSFFRPVVILLRSVPVISFVLLALLWFSPEGLPVFIALVTAFPILHQSISTALLQTDERLVEMAKAFGKKPLARFMHIYLPSAKKLIYDGASTAIGFGWRAIIMGEALAQPLHGIGSGMKAAQAFIQVPRLMAWTIAAIAISYLFELLLQSLRKIKRVHKLPAMHATPPRPGKVIRKSIQVQNVYKQFGTHTIFDGINMRFDNDVITCIKGASGRGKTTLLRLIAGLDRNYTGTIVRPAAHTLSYAFQEDRLLPWLNVQNNIAYAAHSAKGNRQETSNLIGYLLDRLHLSEHAEKYPHQLSGGQRQRVNLARALAMQADILLLDEPLTGMDEALKADIIRFVHEWIDIYRPITLWATHENIPNGPLNVRELILN